MRRVEDLYKHQIRIYQIFQSSGADHPMPFNLKERLLAKVRVWVSVRAIVKVGDRAYNMVGVLVRFQAQFSGLGEGNVIRCRACLPI